MRDIKILCCGDMMVRNGVDYDKDKSLFPLVSRTVHWWVELSIKMELEVSNTFIRKIITRRQ
jgi:hypothetical protein